MLVALDGDVLATAAREHTTSSDRSPGRVEMDAAIWWDESVAHRSPSCWRPARRRCGRSGSAAWGPCVLVDRRGRRAAAPGDPLRHRHPRRRPRSSGSTERARRRDGDPRAAAVRADAPRRSARSSPGSPTHEPDVCGPGRGGCSCRARGSAGSSPAPTYLDHHSASQCTPLYDAGAHGLVRSRGPEPSRRTLELPPLVLARRRRRRRSPPRPPPRPGWPPAPRSSPARSTPGPRRQRRRATAVGDLMLMYGTTMFLVNTVAEPRRPRRRCGARSGARPGTRNLAGGMATSGAITAWLRDLFGVARLSASCSRRPRRPAPGANGLLMLPYFAGERTPIADPDARGVHRRAHPQRTPAATSTGRRSRPPRSGCATTRGDARRRAAAIDRIVAVGGGTQGELWTQIVSDVTGSTAGDPRGDRRRELRRRVPRRGARCSRSTSTTGTRSSTTGPGPRPTPMTRFRAVPTSSTRRPVPRARSSRRTATDRARGLAPTRQLAGRPGERGARVAGRGRHGSRGASRSAASAPATSRSARAASCATGSWPTVPAKGDRLPFTFFAIRAAPAGARSRSPGSSRPGCTGPHEGDQGYDAGGSPGCRACATRRMRGEYPLARDRLRRRRPRRSRCA